MKTLLFDLDGTLLPMDVEAFTEKYMTLLAKTMAGHGFSDSKKFIRTIWRSVGAMLESDGSRSNEESFWQSFCSVYGPDARKCEPALEAFYAGEFDLARSACSLNEKAAGLIRAAKENGYRIILATNPIFPRIAVEQRLKWAGVDPEAFEAITTYENSRFCKPDVRYFQDILDQYKLDPKDCLMIGNDTREDTPAMETGMDFFLLEDCLINSESKDIEQFRHGDFDSLKNYLGLCF